MCVCGQAFARVRACVWFTLTPAFIDESFSLNQAKATLPPSRWRHNDRGGVSNNRRLDRLLNRLFRRRSMKTSKLRVIGLGQGNSLVTGEFQAQTASNGENISIWWREHDGGRSYKLNSLVTVWPSQAAQDTTTRTSLVQNSHHSHLSSKPTMKNNYQCR